MTNEIDWNRRRTNLRIRMAALGTNPTRVCREVNLSPNTLSQFTNGRTGYLSEKTLSLILPVLGLTTPTDLDAENILDDPRAAIRRQLDLVPEEDLPGLLRELQARFPGHQ